MREKALNSQVEIRIFHRPVSPRRYRHCQVGEFAWSLPRSAVVTAASSSYKGHRYPPEIIAHCVWLYHRFPLGTVKLIGGLIVRALCVGSGGKPCPSSRSGGGRGNPGDLVPDGEAVGHLVAPSVGRQQMPPRTEMWRDAAERGPRRPYARPAHAAPADTSSTNHLL